MRAFLAGLALAAALAAPAAARAEPPMWVVKDADSEMLLFGSVHVLPPGLAWRPKALTAGLARADDVWFELPVGPATDQAVARLAATSGILPPDKQLFDLLSPADGQRLLLLARIYETDPATLARLEPWLAEVALAAAAYTKAGAQAQYGVEAVLNAAAPPNAKRHALETPAEQIGIFDQTPLDEQIASLKTSITDLENDPDGYMKLVRAWLAGDTKVLDAEALQPLRDASPALFRRLVTQRNARWTAELDARLKGKGRTVVVVGVGHLVGDDGLPSRLRALGYSVTGP